MTYPQHIACFFQFCSFHFWYMHHLCYSSCHNHFSSLMKLFKTSHRFRYCLPITWCLVNYLAFWLFIGHSRLVWFRLLNSMVIWKEPNGMWWGGATTCVGMIKLSFKGYTYDLSNFGSGYFTTVSWACWLWASWFSA